MCNDGSTDGTEAILAENGVYYINNGVKQGKGASIRHLFREAMKLDPEIIITMGADYQHDPSDIPKFVEEIRRNRSDIVVGSRFLPGSNTNISMFRLFGLTIINMLQRILLKCNVRDTQSGFRALRARGSF